MPLTDVFTSFIDGRADAEDVNDLALVALALTKAIAEEPNAESIFLRAGHTLYVDRINIFANWTKER